MGDVLCVHETKWKGEGTRGVGNGLEFYYCGS